MSDEKKYPKVIENVRCVGVTNQEHRFKAPDIGQADHLKVFISTGRNRPSNVVKGDTGRIEYRSVPHRGLWWFEKYKTTVTVKLK
ncbi:MAG TPA: hypothetical protein ENH85_03130 [Candidatus Scalindua sp.]|nr:hypothetical protein [Candidatus Scalindua sp.]